MQTMTIEVISNENDYSKHSVNYFQSWHMGTTINYEQTALQKQKHSCRQPEAVIVTQHHTVGDDCLGFYRPRHHYQIIQEVLYHQSFRWCRRWCITDKSNTDSDEEGNKMYDDAQTDTTDVQWSKMMNFGFWINIGDNLLILVHLICRYRLHRAYWS